MPYIKSEDRKKYYDLLKLLFDKWSFYGDPNPGELNYLFSMICLQYINRKGENYAHYNDIIGALENCKLEIYRRKISEYEKIKIEENGDIYGS